MKKSQTIRELLGFTQAELALLLNVSRSQFSKFETGTRDLPVTAKYLLAEMLKYMQAPDNPLKSAAVLGEQYKQQQRQFERMLKENEYQLLLTSRKIKAVEKPILLK